MSNYLTQHRIAAALAAATQPEGETPWHLLLTKPPTTHADVRMAIVRRRNQDLWDLSDRDEPTILAEASRAEIIQDLARRDGYLTALAAGEHILSTTPVLPTDVDVRLAEWDSGPHLVISFHMNPAAVRRFAAHFTAELVERPHGKDRIHLAAIGITESGVQFEAYTLMDTPVQAVAQ